MQLLSLIQKKMTALNDDADEASKFFGMSKQTLGKFNSGNSGNFSVSAMQKLIDEEIASGRLEYSASPKQAEIKPKPTEDEPEEEVKVSSLALVGSAGSLPIDGLVDLVIEKVAEIENDDRHALIETLCNQERKHAVLLVPGISRLDNAPLALVTAVIGMTKHLRCAGVNIAAKDSIDESRNVLLEDFLKSDVEWAVFVEPWLFPPFGNVRVFQTYTGNPHAPEFVGVNTLERLTRGIDGRKLVGSLHEEFGIHRLACQPEVEPRDEEDKDLVSTLMEKGPLNKIVEVGWISFGCAAIHRSVLQAIIAKNGHLLPKVAGQPFPFFQPGLNRYASSQRFCEMAAKAGFKSHLDCAVKPAALSRKLRA